MVHNSITRFCLSVLLIFSFQALFAQDIHYIQFDATPLAVNPAFTGMFDGNMRVSALYRNQWASVTVPYITYGASVDAPVYTDKHGNYLAAGLQVYKDEAGDGNLSNFSSMASVAYHKFFGSAKKIKDNHSSELGIGLQAGYFQKSIDITSMFFGNAYPDANYWLGLGNSVNYYALNTGLCFSQALGSKFNFTIGLSGYNLTQPHDAMLQTQNKEVGLDKSFSGVFGANWMVADRLSLRPSVLYISRQELTAVIVGNEFHYVVIKKQANKNATSVFLGGWYRTGDVTSITAGIEFRRLRIGMGYDYNIKPLNTSDGSNGGFEVSVRYIGPSRLSSSRKRVIPSNSF